MRLEKQTRKELNEKLSRRALIQANASKRKIIGFGLAQTRSSNWDKDGKYSESINKESSPYAKKKENNESVWFDCDLTDVENLPCNIDDTCIYQL